MQWSLVVLALALLGFAAISGRIEGTPLTPPMAFTAVGLVVGAKALGLDVPPPYGHEIKLLAEAIGGVLAGIAASAVVLLVERKGFVKPTWLQVVPVAGAALRSRLRMRSEGRASSPPMSAEPCSVAYPGDTRSRSRTSSTKWQRFSPR